MGLLSEVARAALRVATCLIGAWVWCAWPAAAQDGIAEREYRLKSSFVYKFAKFVEWPDDTYTDSSSPMVFCVVGDDAFGASLEELVHDKSLKGRRIVVRGGDHLSGYEDCHVVFVARSVRNRIGVVFKTLEGLDILTVGDMDRFAHEGGMINMVRRKNKLRFETNRLAVSRTRLIVSSKLLSLAEIVE